MSKSDVFENDMLKLFFQGTTVTGLADNTATSPVTSLYLSLHTADPGEAGTQSTNEITYTGYARVAVTRSAGGFTVSAAQVGPAAAVNFPIGTGGAGTATHFGIGTAASGAGKLMYSGTITPNIVCGNGITPQLTTSTTITED